jgi:hypothetical protein
MVIPVVELLDELAGDLLLLLHAPSMSTSARTIPIARASERRVRGSGL